MHSTVLSLENVTNRPGSRLHTAQAFFGPIPDVQVDALQNHFIYYHEELSLLRKGISPDSWQIHNLAIETCEDIYHVVTVLRENGELQRPELRQRLFLQFRSSNNVALNNAIDLAIRLWLMINTQESEFKGLRHEATSVQWDDESTLIAFLDSLFPCPLWAANSLTSRLDPHFTAAFMQRICGLKIEWSTSLHDHLRLDRMRKALKVFPYKCHLEALINSYKNSNNKYAREMLSSYT